MIPSSRTEDERKAEIRTQALALGFDAVGFADAAADPADREHLRTYLAEGRHGDMDWMARTAERRADPQTLWPEARSVIVVGVNYGPSDDPLAAQAQADRGAISVYARGRDYHDVLKKRLKAFARAVQEQHGGDARVFVDTAPLMEKPLAARAGVGWIGKHTNLVSRRFGSWLFLGEVLTTLELPPDQPGADLCGNCRRCLDACPTGALPEPYRIEPRRCISYLTIEHKGAIDPELRALMGNRVYGCDDCLAVCPWNKFATLTPHADLQARPELALPALSDLAELDDAAFRSLFAHTAAKRTGRERFTRNVAIAAGNSGRESMRTWIDRLAADVSALVRAAAVWARTHLDDTSSETRSEP